MVSVLDWSKGPGFKPWQGHCVVFLLYSRGTSLSTQVYMYKWVPVNLMLEGNPAMD